MPRGPGRLDAPPLVQLGTGILRVADNSASGVTSAASLTLTAVTAASLAKSNDVVSALTLAATSATDKAKSNASASTLTLSAVTATDGAKSSDTAPSFTLSVVAALSKDKSNASSPSATLAAVTAKSRDTSATTAPSAPMVAVSATARIIAVSFGTAAPIPFVAVTPGARAKSQAASPSANFTAAPATGQSVNPQSGNADAGTFELDAVTATSAETFAPLVSNSSGLNGAGGGLSVLVPLAGAGAGWAEAGSVTIEAASAVGVAKYASKALERFADAATVTVRASSSARQTSIGTECGEPASIAASRAGAGDVVVSTYAASSRASCAATPALSAQDVAIAASALTHLPERSPARIARRDELAARRLGARANRRRAA